MKCIWKNICLFTTFGVSFRIDPDDEDEELKEFEELQKKAEENQELTFIQKGKLFVEDLVKKVGFFGILACASVSCIFIGDYGKNRGNTSLTFRF